MKALAEVLAFPSRASVVPFPIVQCGCKRSDCGRIDTQRDSYIYSKATKEYYSDMVCLTNAVEAVYEPYHRVFVIRISEHVHTSSPQHSVTAKGSSTSSPHPSHTSTL